jgi:sugar (pentulose or hexulose) kinase
VALFAGLDVGTSGGRCLIVDETGARAGYGERPWAYTIDADGFPTLDPTTAFDALRDAFADASRTCDVHELRAIGVSALRTGAVLLDDDGRVLCISPNTDGRAAAEGIQQERAHAELIYGVSGRLPAMIYPPARLAWFRAHHPEQSVGWMLSFGDWIVHALTGIAATEPTQAAEMLVFDVAGGHWSVELLGALNVPAEVVPPIHASGNAVGETQAGNPLGLPAGIAVCPGGADTQCAALGLGVIEPGQGFVVAGTTMLCERVLDEPVPDAGGNLWLSPHAAPGRFVHEAHCGESGAALTWLAGMHGVAAGALAAEADDAPPGAGGVQFFDSFPSTVRDFPLVRTGGFSFPVPMLAFAPTRGALARGLLEGIAFGARAGLAVLEKSDGEPSEVALAGGVARSKAFRDALAGSAQLPMRLATEPASSALGAAIVAAESHFGSVEAAARSMADKGSEIAPDESHGYPALYSAWFERAVELDARAMRMSGLIG